MSRPELHPEFLAALAQQFGFLGAFLGGVSATLFVTLLTLSKPSTVTRWSIGLAAIGAAAFIVTAYLSVAVIAQSHPHAPPATQEAAFRMAQVGMVLSYALGTFALLGSIACSGWSRSRTLGYVTTIVALIAAVPIVIDLL